MAAEAILAAQRTDDPAIQATTALAVTGTPVAGPSFARAPIVGLDIDRLPENRPVIESCLQGVSEGDPVVDALRARLARFTAVPDPHPLRSGDPLEPIDGGGGAPADPIAVAVATELARTRLDRAGGSEWCRVVAGTRAALGAVPDCDPHDRLLVDRARLVGAADRADRARFAALVADLGPVDERDEEPWTTVDLDRCSLRITGLLVLGELAEAGLTLELARSRCERAGISTAPFDRQELVLALELGKPDLVPGLLERPAVACDEAEDGVLRAVAAMQQDSLEAAGAHLDRALTAPGWQAAVAGRRPTGIIALAATVVAALDDRALAERLATLLGTLRRSAATLWAGTVLIGPTAHFHGLVAASAGERRLGRELLVGAEAHARALGARTWLCRTLTARADLAVAAGEERPAVAHWRDEAAATAAEIGARWLDQRR